ncbi:TlpA family protein disulfide reductase [Sphingobacterium bambusae]|uniref:TlpA family protein disulfide reductase n=1 Tax=Sphingobacterium bambusae TaxID=662858 RepID=A0ABW6BH36_9SPHI|nr:TlpA disulfide reductase family protein [Sphingobacterium bambusae]WPL47516.1 TlpA disulfide reductase family protein [Sphingobacterium bambusae]
MKKLTAYLICALLPMLLLAQQNSDTAAITDPEFAQHYASRPQPTIRGKIIHASAEEMANIRIKYSLVHIGQPIQSSYEIRPDANGSFQIVLNERLPNRQIWFTLGDYARLCLMANEELTLTFDLEKLKKNFVYWIGDGVDFGGKDADKNRLINQYIVFQREQTPDIPTQIEALDINRPTYLSGLDSLFKLQNEQMERFFARYGNQHRELITGESTLAYYAKKIAYFLRHDQPLIDTPAILAPVYAISNDTYSYLRVLSLYLKKVGFSATKQTSNLETLARYYDETLPAAYADLLKLYMGHPDLKHLTQHYEAISPSLHFDWSRDYLSEQLTSLRKKIAQIDSISHSATVEKPLSSSLGSLSIKTQTGISLYRSPQQTGESLLKDLRSAYANKLVLIDIWATWCVPCIQAMPYAKKLQEEAKASNLPVEFVYLCTSGGSDEEQWKNKVLEIQQPGTHLFVDSKAISELMTMFNMGGFPSYLLLKPDGSYDEKTVNSLSNLQLDTLKDLLQ